MRKRNITLDHPDCGIRHDQPCKWGIEWDFCAPGLYGANLSKNSVGCTAQKPSGDNGGNFVDTANVYTNGSSEKILGECLGEKRQQIVLSTKYTMNTHPGDPNGGGNHRKSMVRSVETSLQRLKTDNIDLLYLHIWDGTTQMCIQRALGASKLEQLENNSLAKFLRQRNELPACNSREPNGSTDDLWRN
jgi:hypothetical protein